jgi:phage terminase large subunit-like protein
MTPTESAIQYARGVISGEVLAGQYVKLTCQRFLNDLNNEDWRYHYRHDLADHAVDFMEKLRHMRGPMSGKRFKLEPWQRFIECNLFGFVDKETGFRRFRTVYEEIPRKNGKSIRVAARGMYMFCVESKTDRGMECISGASTEKQAWHVFWNCREWARTNEELRNKFGIEVNAKSLIIMESGSKFEPVVGKPGDGGNFSFAAIDEYHEHPDDTLYDTVQTGQGSRSQPMLCAITTAGTSFGPCYEHRQDVISVLNGTVEDESVFGIIYTIDEGDDWTDERSIIKANPNYGISISAEFLQQELSKARRSASKQHSFRTKHQNTWVGSAQGWMNMLAWRKQRKDIHLEDYAGRQAWLGIDLASKKDLAAIAILIPDGDKFVTFYEFFAPERAAEDNIRYRNLGEHITFTPGSATDYGAIEHRLKELASYLECVEMAFDPWQAQYLMQRMQIGGMPVCEFPHQVRTMSDPMKEVESLVLDGRLYHNNPVMDWMMGNVVTRPDHKDNIYPSKENRNDDKCKIDGVVALIMAMGRYLITSEQGSLSEWLADPVAMS